MRNFLLGVFTTIVVALVGAGVLLLTLGTDADPVASPSTIVSPSPTATPSAPTSLEQGQTWLGALDLGSSEVLTDGGTFRDVVARGTGVTVTDKGITADRLDLEVTLPWASAAQQVGPGVELYAAGPGEAGLARTVTVLGQDIPVRAAGIVRAEGGLLVIEPRTIDLRGPDWLDSVASAAARALVTIRQPVQGVPEGMRLTEVRVIDTGFRATLSGIDVTIAN